MVARSGVSVEGSPLSKTGLAWSSRYHGFLLSGFGRAPFNA